MRSFSCGALVAFFAMVSLVPAADSPKKRPAFSADALALFAELTQAYDLDGTRAASGKLDPSVLARLERSKEKEVAEVAKQAPQLKFLQALNRSQNKEILKAFGKQAEEWPKIMAGRVIEALLSPESEKKDIRWAAGLMEELMGTDAKDSPQQAVNRAWSVACVGNGMGLSMRQTMRQLAARGGPGSAAKDSITVSVETDRALGAISLTNRTGRTLHHCLIFTHLEPEKARIEAAAAQEDAVGVFILPALGFSPKLVNGSREAARLRHNFNKQPKGVMIYVPEIPAGGKVMTTLARPDYFLISKGASMSIWCDELAIDPQPADNWTSAREAVETRMRRRIPPKGGRTTGGLLRSTRKPATGDLFYKGAVWRGPEQQGGGRVNPIELLILERKGNTFRADMRWNGRHGRYIEGTIEDGTLTWRGARGERQPGVPHTGKVAGNTVEGDFFVTLAGRRQKLTFKLEYIEPND